MKGLDLIEENRLTMSALMEQLQAVDREESLFNLLRSHVRERIRNFYSRYTTRAHQEELKQEVTEELRAGRLLTGEIPDRIFREAIHTIKKEAMYLHTLLPAIIEEKNFSLREDFMDNSGLDRFYVEELEREYCHLNRISEEVLTPVRKTRT